LRPPVRLRFWSVERLADFFRTIVRLPPITNCPSAVGRYGPELRTNVKIIRERYHAPALTPVRKLSLIEIAERCRRLSMGAQGLRTTFRTSRRGGPPITARRISPIAFLHALHRSGIKIPRGDRSEHRAGRNGGRAANEEHRAGTDGNTDTVAPPTARGWYIGTGAER
jgi:hypothetical protein